MIFFQLMIGAFAIVALAACVALAASASDCPSPKGVAWRAALSMAFCAASLAFALWVWKLGDVSRAESLLNMVKENEVKMQVHARACDICSSRVEMVK